MVVFILERVPATLRGELSRWVIEPRTGVFVGTLSALVRDKLWERIAGNRKVGGAILLYRSNTEQGFAVRTAGDPARAIVDREGLMLVHVHEAASESAQRPGKQEKAPG